MNTIEVVASGALGLGLTALVAFVAMRASTRLHTHREITVAGHDHVLQAASRALGITFQPGATYNHPVVGGIRAFGMAHGTVQCVPVMISTTREGDGDSDATVQHDIRCTITNAALRRAEVHLRENGEIRGLQDLPPTAASVVRTHVGTWPVAEHSSAEGGTTLLLEGGLLTLVAHPAGRPARPFQSWLHVDEGALTAAVLRAVSLAQALSASG